MSTYVNYEKHWDTVFFTLWSLVEIFRLYAPYSIIYLDFKLYVNKWAIFTD